MAARSARPWSALALLLLAFGSCSVDPTDDSNGPPRDVDIFPDAADAGPNAFSPTDIVISLSAQDKVTWFNADFGGAYGGGGGSNHALKSDDDTTFESGNLAPGAVFEVTFSSPGTYTYHCEYHSDMQGTVTVNP